MGKRRLVLDDADDGSDIEETSIVYTWSWPFPLDYDKADVNTDIWDDS